LRPNSGKKLLRPYVKEQARVGYWWLSPVILATWEAEIRRTAV
jgi:hypothetical protein